MTGTSVRTRLVRAAALLGLALAACIALLGSMGQAQAGAPTSPAAKSSNYVGKVERKVLNDTANGKTSQFLVLLSRQADVSSAYGMKDQNARGWYVYNTLASFADKTQAPV